MSLGASFTAFPWPTCNFEACVQNAPDNAAVLTSSLTESHKYRGMLSSRVGSTFCEVYGQHQAWVKSCRIEPIILSAGELESEWAGAPGRLIRDRYRRAAEVAKIRGKLPCLMINDLDAGVGIQEGVQRTVSFSPSARSPYSLTNVLTWHQDFIWAQGPACPQMPMPLRRMSNAV